jgi:putative redox protein
MTVLVTRNQSTPMRQEIRIGAHTLAADESVEQGGGGSAPGAHDLYDAALGACKALTVLWYAKRKGIPVEDIEVRVESDRTQERAGTYRLDAQLRLGGPLTPAQRQELLAVASKCPVHKLMTVVKTEITTSLID